MRKGHDLGLDEVFDDFLHHYELLYHHPVDWSLEFVGLGADEPHHAVDVVKGVLAIGAHLVGGELVTGEVLP